jgi:hypothetical protein
VDEWNARPAEAAAEADLLRAQIRMASANGIAHRLVPLTGQCAGMITEIRPAGDIVRAIAAAAEVALTSWC